MANNYQKSVLGGTFDHLHLGHKKLIDTAFEQSQQVTIGLTKSHMYAHKLLANLIEDYENRERNLKKYLEEKNYLNRATIIPIHDIYGTTLEDKEIEAIFATEENLRNVEMINQKRKAHGFLPLAVITVAYENDTNGKPITSERIRKGEIDSNGFVYKNLFKQTLRLSQNLREELQKPFGEVVAHTHGVLEKLTEQTMVIAVGDIIVSSLIDESQTPAISVIDFRTRRQDIENHIDQKAEKVINEAGTINDQAVDALQKKLDSFLKNGEKQTLIIDGEEDLIALPAILLAPLGAIVVYGQFDQGVVVNEVTKDLKQKIVKILEKFE